MQSENFAKRYGLVIATGLVVGAAAVALTFWGNPANMGFCISKSTDFAKTPSLFHGFVPPAAFILFSNICRTNYLYHQ